MTTQLETLSAEHTRDDNLELQVLAKVAQKQMAHMRADPHQQMKAGWLSPQLDSGDDCLNMEYNDMIQAMSSPVVEPSGMRSWMWQTCTEFGFYQTCGENCPFASHFQDEASPFVTPHARLIRYLRVYAFVSNH